MRLRIALVTLVLAGCGGGEKGSPPAAGGESARGETPAATRGEAARPGGAPRWPGVVAFAAEDAGLDVHVAGPDGTRRLTRGKRDEFSPAFSPDGHTIAYRVNPPRGDEGDIWTMAASGKRKRNLTRSPGVADWSPAFSPDGRTIAYMSSAGGTHELWLMARDGGDPRQLTSAGELSEYPSWSPDGRAVAFGGTRGGNFEILTIAATGGPERNLTANPARDQWPAWSPDGTKIAFMSDRDGGEDVFVMDADGAKAHNVTNTPDRTETHPAWTPDGRLSFLEHGESGPVQIRVLDGHDLPVDAVFVFDWF